MTIHKIFFTVAQNGSLGCTSHPVQWWQNPWAHSIHIQITSIFESATLHGKNIAEGKLLDFPTLVFPLFHRAEKLSVPGEREVGGWGVQRVGRGVVGVVSITKTWLISFRELLHNKGVLSFTRQNWQVGRVQSGSIRWKELVIPGKNYLPQTDVTCNHGLTGTTLSINQPINPTVLNTFTVL